LLAIPDLHEQNSGPSFYDFSSLMAAIECQGILITGDGALRRAAKRRRIMVHGVLWLLDKMIEHGILQPLKAAICLERIIEAGSRLPHEECIERLKCWKN